MVEQPNYKCLDIVGQLHFGVQAMDISVFGLGYVGCVTAGCITDNGHNVVGVDVNPQKVKQLSEGEAPIDEPGLDRLVEKGVASGRLETTTDASKAVERTEVTFISVGTPPGSDGELDTTNLYNVMDSISASIESKEEHTIVIRSTVHPRTTERLRSYLSSRIDTCTVNFLVNPEFLREGTAIEDFYHPPYIIIGSFEGSNPEPLISLYDSLAVDGSIHVVDPEIAESLKLVNNTFHALKIVFANEIGSLASTYDIDGKELMKLVCDDTKLNISSEYMEPGLPFGGACLPKDCRATAKLGGQNQLETPLVKHVMEGNRAHYERVASKISDLEGEKVGILGISFKRGTTDIRNSPGLEVAKRLEKEISIYPTDVQVDSFVGAERDYLDQNHPDIGEHIVSDHTAFLRSSDIIFITNPGEYEHVVSEIEDQIVVDPVGALKQYRSEFYQYERISW